MIKDFNEIPNTFNYYLDKDLKVFSFKGGVKRYPKESKNGKGYNQVSITVNNKTKSVLVHRVIAKTFIQNPKNKPQVNHINGIKTDNRICNLEWCTAKENAIHAHKTGLTNSAKGEGLPYTKLKAENIPVIRGMLLKGDTQRVIGQKFNIHRSVISKIKRGHNLETYCLACNIIKNKLYLIY